MPSNQTPNYQLSQWEANDRVQRTDFNADNAKIDAALGALAKGKADITALTGLAKIAYGSYTGTGEYGQAHPNTLTFPFPPKIVFIALRGSASASEMALAIRGQTYFCNLNSTGGGAHCDCTWEGNTLTWYTTSNAGWQMNASTYFYVALG